MKSRWAALWQRLNAPLPDGLFEALATQYAEPHRHYHTAQHIAECLVHMDSARSLCTHDTEVELALWFHDAVYEPRAKDNEAQSADWAVRVMCGAGLPANAGERVRALIMKTCHDALPDTPDAQVLVDIDLAILGADTARFDEYERQIRQEYAWVPGFLFRRKRREVLEGFLGRPVIYSTSFFNRTLEKKARENLARALSALR